MADTSFKFGTNLIPVNGNYVKFGTNNLNTVKFASITVWSKESTGPQQMDINDFDISWDFTDRAAGIIINFTIPAKYSSTGELTFFVTGYVETTTGPQEYNMYEIYNTPTFDNRSVSITLWPTETEAEINTIELDIQIVPRVTSTWTQPEDFSIEY